MTCAGPCWECHLWHPTELVVVSVPVPPPWSDPEQLALFHDVQKQMWWEEFNEHYVPVSHCFLRFRFHLKNTTFSVDR